MRASLAIIPVAAFVGSMLGLQYGAPTYSAATAPAQSTPVGQSSSCIGGGSVTVVTPSLRICEESEITVSAEAACPICRAGVNVVFVIPNWVDDPAWMANESRGIVDSLVRLKETDEISATVRVGVVRYDGWTQRVALRLTEQLRDARGHLLANTPDECRGYDGCPCAALIGSLNRAAPMAMNMIRDVRREAELGNGDATCDYVILFTEGSDGSCLGFPMLPNARQTIQAGHELRRYFDHILVGCPSEIDENCFAPREIAPNPSVYFEPPQTNRMPATLRNLFDRLDREQLLRGVTIVQDIPAGLSYVDGSASTPPDTVVTSTEGTRLQWSWERAFADGPHSVSYRVGPEATGAYTVTGSLEVRDSTNRSRSVVLPSGAVTVTELCELPATATPTASPTIPSSPTPTPTATVEPSPTATSTPKPSRLFLPLLLWERCDADRRKGDIALVIDASTSMLELTGSGDTKLAAALSAARVFLDQLNLGVDRDRAAIVSFNAEATVRQGLTADRGALDSALAAIELAQQTCLPCAVEVAESVLEVETGTSRVKTMVLLTDGRSNPRPVSEAIAAATAAKSRGILVFTVGIGADLDTDALRSMASKPNFFFQSPDADDLEQIYLEIASLLPCPPFWPDNR